MPLQLEDYRNQITPVSGDFQLEIFLRGWSKNLLLESVGVKRPEILRHVADAFLDAGARLLVAPTDRANVATLAKEIDDEVLRREDVAEMIVASIRICRAAVDEQPVAGCRVIGAMGPTEELVSLDEIEADVLFDAYRDQAQALATAGADAIICRGFTEIESLVIAVKAARKGTELPVIGSMSFDAGTDFTETVLGVSVADACRQLCEAGAAVVGCDRGEYPDATATIVSRMKQSCDRPIWAEINAGLPDLREQDVVYSETPQEYVARLEGIVNAGATFIAGGRGASVAHIAQLAAALRKRPRRKSSGP